MANPVASTDIASQLATLFDDELVAQMNRACPEAAMLLARPGPGKNFSWDVRFGTNTPGGGTQNEGADISSYNNDTYVPAVLQYANFFEPFALNEKAIMSAAVTGNPRDLEDLAAEAISNAAERLASNFADQIYNGDSSTNNLWGFYASGAPAIGDVGAYAGIDPNTYTQWVGNVVDAQGGDADVTLLRSLRAQTRIASGWSPDLWICDPTQFDKIAASYDEHRRWVDEVTRVDGAKIKIDGGVEILSFEGATIMWSRNHPAQKITAINRRWVHLSQLPDVSGQLGGNASIGSVPLAGTTDEQGKPAFRLQVRIKRLAESGDARKFSLFMYPVVVVRRRNACGYITNLSA